MRWTQRFIPTLREAPSDAVTVHDRLLVRAGYIRQIGTGLYAHLPLAQRSLAKIAALLRRELQSLYAQDLSLPALVPSPLASDATMNIPDASGRQLAL